MNKIRTNEIKHTVDLAGIYDVFDPESGLNIVDFRLVNQNDFEEEAKEIMVNIALTTQFYPLGELILDATTNAMHQVFTDYQILIAPTFDFYWDVNMISEEKNDFLKQLTYKTVDFRNLSGVI